MTEVSEEKEMIREFIERTAYQNEMWVRQHPLEACRLIWWLIGYSGLIKEEELERRAK